VTRIIAGRAGGTVLQVPGAGTRPTSDRVRESLFGALESADALRDARVADLYAGSGALGLEAWSRGAASVDLVERSGAAAAVAGRNTERVGAALGSTGAARVHRSTVSGFLAVAHGPYDLVFLDPPYDLDDAELDAALAGLVPRLAPNALVIVERAARSPQPVPPSQLTIERHRRYGDTAMWWLRNEDPQPRAASQS